MSSLPLYQVHAFSSAKLGGGNPAAVVLVPPTSHLDDATRQLIAKDMNLSETAFIQPMPDSSTAEPFTTDSQFGLRWFTPTTEVPMCGHATMASAAVLFQECGNTSPSITFHTLSGPLTVRRVVAAAEAGTTESPDQSSPGSLKLQMALPPADPQDPLPPPLDTGLDSEQAQALLKACVGDLQVSEVAFSGWNNLNYLVLRLDDTTTQQQLEAIQPDCAAMQAAATAEHIHGVIVTCKGGDTKYDFVSRFFGPWMGIPEDPVTGSAHAVLGPYWSRKLGGKGSSSYQAFGPRKIDVPVPASVLRARQCSERGGELEVLVQPNIGQVLVTGTAVVVLAGTLRL